MWREYRRAYRDCAVWLLSWCAPARWYVDTYRACAELRRAVTMAHGPVPCTVAPRVGEIGGATMARPRTVPTGMIDRFWYTPGDGRVYIWTPGRTVITVHAISVDKRTAAVTVGPELDTIPTPVLETASSMAAAVDTWRGGRVYRGTEPLAPLAPTP